jgi:hypothetical protein
VHIWLFTKSLEVLYAYGGQLANHILPYGCCFMRMVSKLTNNNTLFIYLFIFYGLRREAKNWFHLLVVSYIVTCNNHAMASFGPNIFMFVTPSRTLLFSLALLPQYLILSMVYCNTPVFGTGLFSHISLEMFWS